MAWDRAELDALRRTGDLEADPVVAELLASGELSGVNQILRAFDDNSEAVPQELPPVLRDFLHRTASIPEWADPERIAGAYEFFRDDGPQLASVLATGTMVCCFGSVHGAKVMTLTHRLDEPSRRIAETLQFLLYMMAREPLGPDGRLVRACQKVRLVHAAVRHFVAASGQWDHTAMGTPVNQEEMLGGVVLFSVCAAEGAKRLGVHVTPKELRDYYHLWRVTGALLGVDAAIMPDTPEAAMALWPRLKARVRGPSPEGIRLTRTLIEHDSASLPTGFKGLLPALIRRTTDPDIADWMAVPHSVSGTAGVRAAVGLSKVLERLEDRVPAAERVLDRLGQNLLTDRVRAILSGEEQEFDIPESLRADWGNGAP
ncbi:oxygenase MpaB family protein [Streptomyces niveiscabiei]|uniref:oxygenase MpaB family protein n=1 Tax=Streptomyces niveiscabiei TaxID=164115 RepID=UPI0029A5608C|nr:oxygenase MpaB family protein [Streptomyces niveiscabiei]MDX3386026.1 oxygenase MpaB family protein [Streptomyces niveiscabiei]